MKITWINTNSLHNVNVTFYTSYTTFSSTCDSSLGISTLAFCLGYLATLCFLFLLISTYFETSAVGFFFFHHHTMFPLISYLNLLGNIFSLHMNHKSKPTKLNYTLGINMPILYLLHQLCIFFQAIHFKKFVYCFVDLALFGLLLFMLLFMATLQFTNYNFRLQNIFKTTTTK